MFLGNHKRKFKRRLCLDAYTSENMLMIQRLKCEQEEIISIRISIESHLHSKKDFQRIPFYFRNIADFEAEKEIVNSTIGNKTTMNNQ